MQLREYQSRIGLALVATLALAACATGDQGRVASVTIANGDVELIVDEKLKLEAEVVASGSASRAVTWSSSAPDVASISAAGELTAASAGNTTVTATSEADSSKSASIVAAVVPAGSVKWTRQFGTTASDSATGVATDASANAYVTGSTDGLLTPDGAGGYDVLLRKYSSTGEVEWTRQFGSDATDRGSGVATDLAGNVFIVGETYGALAGPHLGFGDVWIRKYTPAGAVAWTRQFGTTAGDHAHGVATDADGSVVVVGYTYGVIGNASVGFADAFVRKYDAEGDIQWTRQFGSDQIDRVSGVAIDEQGNVFVAGDTLGALVGSSNGSQDTWVRKYDPTGAVEWTRQFGTDALDDLSDVATDTDGNVLLIGTTAGALAGPSAGSTDVWLRKYNADGDIVWTRQFGTADDDVGSGTAADAEGNVIAIGGTEGTIATGSAGSADAWVRKYDPAGSVIWTRQFGTGSSDHGHGVATDLTGAIVAVGETSGALVGVSSGGQDAWVRRYSR